LHGIATNGRHKHRGRTDDRSLTSSGREVRGYFYGYDNRD
jgi:hypothetical protein